VGARPALDLAIEAAERHLPGLPPAARGFVERAVALARFEVLHQRGEPFYSGELSGGRPEPPGRLHADPVIDALLRALVWEADCAEFTDAVHNARQYLTAAGYLELIESV
jgi:hypothetical protein